MKRRLLSGESPGLLALLAKRPVGWCALGRRDEYPQYERKADDSAVWAIPCIYLVPGQERKKVGSALIEAAADLAAKNGASLIEGPPPWWLPGNPAAVAFATELFLKNGFGRVGPGARMPELSRTLA